MKGLYLSSNRIRKLFNSVSYRKEKGYVKVEYDSFSTSRMFPNDPERSRRQGKDGQTVTESWSRRR